MLQIHVLTLSLLQALCRTFCQLVTPWVSRLEEEANERMCQKKRLSVFLHVQQQKYVSLSCSLAAEGCETWPPPTLRTRSLLRAILKEGFPIFIAIKGSLSGCFCLHLPSWQNPQL